ncbi:hypothetical protein GGTG_04426 [Gaeumannomyces tritici R3-111a-1]|uniref:Uncharacterized protein n=1 Tax=Gaeumannomyces tritici (strain R3-111a-1) TaxID=644352 RepID=J3NT28_GAET3|nr:hypothetical protein GGTG_04426 [Gaeumannomyces tritici R3-111a-1]EJT79341.1 hypothetical protein GGTG_04426 [Gaeumannomyces tritici R3-111a-1]
MRTSSSRSECVGLVDVHEGEETHHPPAFLSAPPWWAHPGAGADELLPRRRQQGDVTVQSKA